jgi:arginine/ornithine transport system ATP-binding protein
MRIGLARHNKNFQQGTFYLDMSTNIPALKVEGMFKSFGEHEVLKGIDLTANTGDVISIIGSSGSGKSTFLRCINLLETPNSGAVHVHGELIKMRGLKDGSQEPADKKQLQRIRTKLAMVFQSFNLWSHLTILENVIEAPVHVLGIPKKEAIERADALLHKVGMYERRDYYPGHISGGQQQRAAIARAEEGRTMLVVTHEMGFAKGVSSHVMYLHQGRVEEFGAPKEVFENPKSERMKQFLQRDF